MMGAMTTSSSPAEPQSQPDPGAAAGPDNAIDLALLAVGAGLVLAFLAWGTFGQSSLETTVSTSMNWVIRNFAWLYVSAADTFLVVALILAFSKYGRIRLAPG